MTKKEVDTSELCAWKSFPVARLMAYSGPSMQIFLAAYLAHRYPTILTVKDVAFCVMYPVYLLLFANRLRFKSNLPIRQRPKDHTHNSSVVVDKFFSGSDEKWFQKYMATATIIGLLLPIIAILRAPSEVAVLIAPHLYVLWCQIITESITMVNPYVNRYINFLVPVGFSIYRTPQLAEWFLKSLALYNENVSAVATTTTTEIISSAYTWGLALAGLNLVFWSYNLFVMLLLRIAPEFLKEETCEYPEVQVISLPFIHEPVNKMAEAKSE